MSVMAERVGEAAIEPVNEHRPVEIATIDAPSPEA
jgi:hypothetical protein